MKYANAAQALVSLTDLILATGDLVEVRGSLTREIRHQSVSLANPLDRNVVVPERRNNIFATIAESMWVLAGRNDVAFLAPYLPRAAEFSDDGTTWRAGYGPRLRNWRGTDQLDAVRRLLIEDPSTRRAVMSIFDPVLDFAPSRDIPCTNWISFSLRDGVLDMSIAIRSNDLFWGFSGINTFEWSLLQEVMAFWVGAQVGEAHYFIASLHIYERHFDRSAKIIAGPGAAPNWYGSDRSAFNTGFEDIAKALEAWFSIESTLRGGHVDPLAIENQRDPLLRDFSRMLRAYWEFARHGRDPAEAILRSVEDPGLRASGRDYLAWKSGDVTIRPRPTTIGDLIPAVLSLHRTKDRMYGDSWKRRGEQMAVLANIARKLDRLSRYKLNRHAGGESWLDTTVDLFIYSLKYKTFLLDALGTEVEGASSWSDGPEGFEILAQEGFQPLSARSLVENISSVEAAFAVIENSIANNGTQTERLEMANDLITAAAALLEAEYAVSPAAAAVQMADW